MVINSKNLLLFFLLFLAGSAVGFLVGGYTGTNFGVSLIANSSLRKDAGDIQTHVGVLRALRSAQGEAAIEQIEAYIDDALIIFDPHEPYPGLDDATIVAVNEAIKAVYHYRLEFPRQSSRSHVDTMIENLFNKHNLENQ